MSWNGLKEADLVELLAKVMWFVMSKLSFGNFKDLTRNIISFSS